MNFRKKKPPIVTEQPSIRMHVEELPTTALEFSYNELMKDYENNPREEIQKKLISLSRILNDRAYTYKQGNGKLKGRIQEKFPDITDEKFKTMSNDEKNQLEKSLDAYEQLTNIAQKITQPQTDEPIEMKIDTPKKKGLFSKLIHDIPKEEKIKELSKAYAKTNKIIIEENERIKIEKNNPKEPKMGFLKKRKIIKQAPLSLIADQVGEATSSSVNVTPEQKERAKMMQAATVKKLLHTPLFKKKVEDGKPKLDLKKLDDVYCTECKHSIKQHQKDGKSTGCSKCGCLATIEEIAENKGVQLYEPRIVLDKIAEENRNVEELMKQTQSPPPPPPTKEELDKEYIKEQAAKIASMSVKPKQQAPTPTQKKTGLEDSEQAILEKEVIRLEKVIDKTQLDKTQCTCDHQLEDHYDNVEFCTVVGCQCKEFREYPI